MKERYPIYPYRYERNINKEKSYLIDGNGIVWILIDRIINDRDYGRCYYDGCLLECITYIVMYHGFYNYLNIKKHIREHLISREMYYNTFIGQYDNMYLSKR